MLTISNFIDQTVNGQKVKGGIFWVTAWHYANYDVNIQPNGGGTMTTYLDGAYEDNDDRT